MPDLNGNKFLSFKGDPHSAKATSQASLCDFGKWAMEINITPVVSAGLINTGGTFHWISSQCNGQIVRENPPKPCSYDRFCTTAEANAGCPDCWNGMHPIYPGCCGQGQSPDCANFVLAPRNLANPYTVLKNSCGVISNGTVLTASSVTNFLRTNSVSFLPNSDGSGKCFIIGWISNQPMCRQTSVTASFYFDFNIRLVSSSSSNNNQKIYSLPLNSKLGRKVHTASASIAAAPTYTSIGDSTTFSTGFSASNSIGFGAECWGLTNSSICGSPPRADVNRVFYIRFGCDYGNNSIFTSTTLPTLEDCQPCKDKTI